MNFVIFAFAFLVFNLIVFSHELGHYLTARLFNVKVEEFALGMGPKIISKRKEDTTYSLRCLPLGGFCILEGEEKFSENETSLYFKPLWQKVIVFVAGGVMNLILGLIFAFIIFGFRGTASTVISSFEQNSVSSSSGLEIGDQIIAINGKKMFVGRDISFMLITNRNEDFNIEVIRNGMRIILNNVKFNRILDSRGNYHSEVDFKVNVVEKTFLNLINYSILDIYSMARISVLSILNLIKGYFSIRDMSGPIGVASQVGSITRQSLKINFLTALIEILNFMTMFSVSVGMFNLFPLPALDGGRVLFLLVEKVYGRKFKPGIEASVHAIGFWLLMLLMLAISYNDIIRLIKGFG